MPAVATTTPAPANLAQATADISGARLRWLNAQQQTLSAALLKVKRTRGMEVIHKSRVMARRLRTLLHYWRKDCHPVMTAELLFELRNLGRLLAATREADVHRQLLAELLRNSPEAVSIARNLLLSSLDEARAQARLQLRTTVRSDHWNHTVARIQLLLGDERLLAIPRLHSSFAADLEEFHNQVRKLRKNCGRKQRNIKKLHALRIKVKKARYLGEALAELTAESPDAALKFLRQTQNLLGDIHDNHQIEMWLTRQPLDAALKVLLEARLSALRSKKYALLDELQRTHRNKSKLDLDSV